MSKKKTKNRADASMNTTKSTASFAAQDLRADRGRRRSSFLVLSCPNSVPWITEAMASLSRLRSGGLPVAMLARWCRSPLGTTALAVWTLTAMTEVLSWLEMAFRSTWSSSLRVRSPGVAALALPIGAAVGLLVGDQAGSRLLVQKCTERMVLVEAIELATTEQQERAVADARPSDALAIEIGDYQRASHSRKFRVRLNGPLEGLVGCVEHGLDLVLWLARHRQEVLQRLVAYQLARHLARDMSTHTIRKDCEHNWRTWIGSFRPVGIPDSDGVFLIFPRALGRC